MFFIWHFVSYTFSYTNVDLTLLEQPELHTGGISRREGLHVQPARLQCQGTHADTV